MPDHGAFAALRWLDLAGPAGDLLAMSGPENDPGATTRRVMRRAESAALASALARDDSGWPYGSLVLVALDQDASPLLLLSELADHSRNIARDPRVSLLFDGTGGWRERLAGPRVTVLGEAERTAEPRLRARFLARHPSARAYADFKDFHLYRVRVVRAHLVAGFGEIHWLDAAELLLGPRFAPLIEAEPGVIEHMNQDHGDALDQMAQGLLGARDTGWRMAALDPEGFEIRREEVSARLDFEHPAASAAEVRRALIALLEKARAV